MTGRVVLVTGASSGIGRATALHAAAEGDDLVLVARGRRALTETARECEAAGAASTMVVPADVGDDAAVRECVRRTIERHERLDVVVSSAGVVAYGRTEDVPPEIFEKVLRTNLIGAVNLARHVVPVLRRQQRGSLVLVGSLIGHIAVPTMSPYVLSKWGVRALARQLRLENADLRDVDVVYVAPGGVDTPIYRQGANVAGLQGRPPPPVASPERTARQIMSRLESPHARAQLSLANELIRFGFAALPRAYDVLVGPLFRLAALDPTAPVPDRPGNVLAPQEQGNALRGGHGNALLGIGRTVVSRILALTPGGSP